MVTDRKGDIKECKVSDPPDGGKQPFMFIRKW